MDGVRGEGENLVLGVLAGGLAAVIGAVIWMGITVATGWHVGYVALGVGALVGLAIRTAGNGTGFIFGAAGAVLTLLGCLGGEILATIQLATTPQRDFVSVLSSVNLVEMVKNIATQTDPIMYLIYAIGIFEGYKLSIRK